MFFNAKKLNVLGISKGDIVEVILDGEECGRKIKSVVTEVSDRWFRIIIKKKIGSYYKCIHFVSTNERGTRLKYRIIKKGESL